VEGNLATDLPLRLWHATESQPRTGGILTGYLTGATTPEMQLRSPEALLEGLRREAEPASGPWPHMPGQVLTTDWTGDAYAGGGWIVYPLSPNADLRTIAGQPRGHCSFAGEHLATEHEATMEGALRSGHEAARRLLALQAG
jgi:monoamine oxidase